MKQFTKRQKESLLEELWKEASFNPQAIDELEKIAKSFEKNPSQSQDFFNKRFASVLSTTRNRLLITQQQQQVLSQTCVGFFGLSVGSHAALTWTMVSRPDTIKISDPDYIDPSNLNRLRFGWSSVRKGKVRTVSRAISELHPFVTIRSLTDTDAKSMVAFCNQKPRVHIIVDEIDDIAGKVTLRQIARQQKIPLISAVDVGDNVFLDVERYDMTPQPQFFLGRLPGIESIAIDTLSIPQKIKLIVRLVGLEHNSEAMLLSLLSLGKTIGTWPQLGTTAVLAGGIIAATIKKIRLGDAVASGRYYLDMDMFYGVKPTSEDIRSRKTLIKKVTQRLKL